MERFACVHGHFYQPPREDPWTGEIERQPSAGRDHDWNRRIARECYGPNGSAAIKDGHGRVLERVNNYAHLSFDFGPTLLSWYEKAHPEGYAAILQADRDSRKRLDGHGNAMAMAYNHMILPLAAPRDQRAQVRWGLADFRARFGRKAEALWLAETACNGEALNLLIDEGLTYVLLAPTQAQSVRSGAEGSWTDVSDGSIDVSRPYLWRGARGSISIFFYDGGLSHSVGFGRAMSDSPAFAARLESSFGAGRGARLISVATDGETYGHHQHFAELGLAHLLTHELPRRGVPVVNYGWYLAKYPPRGEVLLKAGDQGLGTAWSCAHGLGRWLLDCGCGTEGGNGRWRLPLRGALDWLRDGLAEIYAREGGRLLRDPWAARDAYIDVLLGGREALPRFLSDHLGVSDTPEHRLQVLRLLEMQKHALYMYTSCGWFFADISGLEAVQNLRYAARAVELARQAAGAELEEGFLERLKRAPSADHSLRDGAGVYKERARPRGHGRALPPPLAELVG